MRDNKKKDKEVKRSPAREGHLFKRRKQPAYNKMWNDISGETKIANGEGKPEATATADGTSKKSDLQSGDRTVTCRDE